MSDDALIKMIEIERKNYTEEALNIANTVLVHRGGLNALKDRITNTVDDNNKHKNTTSEFKEHLAKTGGGIIGVALWTLPFLLFIVARNVESPKSSPILTFLIAFIQASLGMALNYSGHHTSNIKIGKQFIGLSYFLWICSVIVFIAAIFNGCHNR
jgi:hypothetical protein